jgi:ribosomal protein S18 acetylase RimI-like enzyme
MSMISSIENSFFAVCRYWGILNDSYYSQGSIQAMQTGIDSADLNMAWSEKPLSQEDASVIKRIQKDFDKAALPFWWWIFPCAKTAETVKMLYAAGCSFVQNMPCLLADLRWLPEDEAYDSKVLIQPVGCREDLALWRDISFAGFEFPRRTGGQFDRFTATFDLQANSPQKNFLAFVQGKPVAASLFFLNAETAGIYFVTTLTEYRKQGIGLELIRATMRYAAKAGARYAVLQSSPDGLSVYQRAGFKEYCRVDLYGRIEDYQL